ncbi:MAG: protein kinase [Planctomycetota bacterium]
MTGPEPDLFELFQKACELEPEAQKRFLVELAQTHPEIAREVRELLDADEKQGKLPKEPSLGPIPTASVEDALGAPVTSDAEATLQSLRNETARADRYESGVEVGRGAMGLVRKSWDCVLRRELALKSLRRRDSQGTGPPVQALERFLQEARITASLEHPGIVPVHDLGIDSNGQVFFAMRYVDGLDLESVFRLARDGSADWPRTRLLGLLQRVCEAMSFAHARGVLHRDLKPTNIMVGRFGEVYVMDWGVAKVPHEETCDVRVAPEAISDDHDAQDSPLISRSGTIIGTPAYMPPEQATGDRDDLGPHSDVYSVGAILYQLLTGRMPYLSPDRPISTHAMLEKLMSGPPVPISRLAPEAPAELIAICERAMARDPSDRYPEMGAMAEDLRAFLEQRVVSAYEAGAWAEAKKWVLRNRSIAVLGSLLLTSVLAGLGASSYIESRAAETLSQKNDTLAEQRDRAARERDKATAIQSFVVDMLSSANPSKGNRADIMVRDVLAQMEQEVELIEQPEVGAELHLVFANAYRGLDLMEASVRHRRRALELYRGLLPEDDALLARLMIEVADGGATLERAEDELEADLRLVNEGIAIAERLGGELSELVVEGVGTRAALMARLGVTIDSDIQKTFEAGVDLVYGVNYGRIPKDEIREWLSTLPGRVARAWEAGRLDEVSLIMRDRTQGTIDDPFWGPQVPTCFMRYADWLELQDLDSAAAGVRYEAYRVAEDVWEENSLSLADWRLEESRTALEQGRLDEAERLGRQAHEALLAHFGPSEPKTIDAIVQLADIQAEHGDLPGARETLETGLKIARDDLPSSHPAVGRLVQETARRLIDTGELEAARDLLLPPLMDRLARRRGRASLEISSLRLALARAHLGLDETTDAETHLLAVLDWAESVDDDEGADLRSRAGELLEELYRDRGESEKLKALQERLQKR